MKTKDPYGIASYKEKKAVELEKDEAILTFMSDMIKEVRRMSSAIERIERELAKK